MMRVLLFLFPLFCISCVKENPITPETPSLDLIVEGGIYGMDTVQYIKLTKPFIPNTTDAGSIHGAQITVSYGLSTSEFKEIDNSGVYSGIVKNSKKSGQAFKLRIHYGNKTYTSTDTMPPQLPNAALPKNLIAIHQDHSIRISYPKHTFGNARAMRQLILESPSVWKTLSGGSKGNYRYSYSHPFGVPNALGSVLSPAINQEFSENAQIDFYTFSLSMAYADYLYRIFQETEWKGALSPNASNVTGNITGGAGGFFYTINGSKNTIALSELAL